MPIVLAAIAVGASAGAILRWVLSNWLNSLYVPLPLGTLAANLIGGYLVGVALAVLGDSTSLSPLWRLLLVTGFLGSLTTFSTFSAEVVMTLLDGRMLHALTAIAAHVLGSLVCTALGIATVRWLSGSFTLGG